MRIGILGTGRMGSELGRLWAARGHEIFFGSRTPSKAAQLAESIGHLASGGTHDEAVAFGQAVVAATPWSVTLELIRTLGPWKGKILIDITNPLAGRIPEGIITEAGAEQVVQAAPDARVVKAFNAIFFKNLENPAFANGRAASFYCGDDAEAKHAVATLSREMGFDPVDAGPLANARLLEPLALLWMQLAGGSEGPDTAFGWLRREG